MSDTKSIDDLIGLKLEDNDSDVTVDERGEVQLEHKDKDTEMTEMMRSMKMTMESMAKRINKLEVDVKIAKLASHVSKPKDMFSMPNPDAHRHTASPVFRSRDSNASVTRDDDTESFTNTELWGVCFASLMYGAIMKYMQTTGESGHVIDGIALMKTYSKIVDVLYARIKSSDLPAVQAASSNFMATSLSRRDSDSLPESSAVDWYNISQHPDGVECMSVIESIFMAAQKVPEAMVHPISQLIPQIKSPVVRKMPKGPSFSIVSTAKVSMSPNGYENFCRYLKMAALKTYVSR
ncbi:hypothetical protein LTS09_016494 [Friedmanniomyces endolithicus]|nr:hypothetical protein LTS09_016494 [Friedmanniomyces endolithicus]